MNYIVTRVVDKAIICVNVMRTNNCIVVILILPQVFCQTSHRRHAHICVYHVRNFRVRYARIRMACELIRYERERCEYTHLKGIYARPVLLFTIQFFSERYSRNDILQMLTQILAGNMLWRAFQSIQMIFTTFPRKIYSCTKPWNMHKYKIPCYCATYCRSNLEGMELCPVQSWQLTLLIRVSISQCFSTCTNNRMQTQEEIRRQEHFD